MPLRMIKFSRVFKLLEEFIIVCVCVCVCVCVPADHSQTYSLASVSKPMEEIMYKTGVAYLNCGV